MDSKDNFLRGFKNLISTIDVEYLIGISNKGTVNRAKKDLEKVSNIEYDIKEDNIEFKIDDIICTLSSDIQKYKCSCPSRSICKHVIMGYIYLIENRTNVFSLNEDKIKESANKIEALYENIENEKGKNHIKEDSELKETEEKSDRFIKLKDISIDEIKKLAGEKVLENAIRRIIFGTNACIKEDSIITVEFNDENIIVKFLDKLENSTCNCKSKAFCRHKAEALILYKLKKDYVSLNELEEMTKRSNGFNQLELKKAALKIRSLIENILVIGLSRLPETVLDDINNLAIISHSANLPNFEKNLRDIREELSLYINKNASFVKERLLNKLTSLYTKAISIENTNDIKKINLLSGEFKSSYYEIPPIKLYGIGEENWRSKSGYEGTTYYFFEERKKEIFTYTNTMPIYYDNTNKYRRAYNELAPWQLNCKIEELSRINFKLVNGKVNNQNRISSSSESKGEIIGKSIISELSIENLIYDNWQLLIEKIFLNEKSLKENHNLIILKPYKLENSQFNDVYQKFSMELYDKEEHFIKIQIEFSPITKSMIRKLERISKVKEMPLFLGRIYIYEGILNFYPITIYLENGESQNLT